MGAYTLPVLFICAALLLTVVNSVVRGYRLRKARENHPSAAPAPAYPAHYYIDGDGSIWRNEPVEND